VVRLGRTILLFFIVLAAGPVAIGVGATPASAQVPNELTITKVVDGPAPPGAEWVVDIDCEGAAIQPSSQLTFTGPGSETVQVFGGVTCTVVETTTAGATVSYACEVTSPDENPAFVASCVGDNEVDFEAGGHAATITVTNSYAAPPVTTPPGAAAAEPPPAEPVTEAPRFTG
jgi:hypothetical protein